MMITNLSRYLKIISWYSKIWNIYLRWDQYNFFSLEEDRTKQPNWQVIFCLKRVWIFCVYNFCWMLGRKVGFNVGCHWSSLLWPSIFNLGILKVACKIKPQEDEWGGEGGMVDNIGGEVGSIPPYPTFIPPGPKKLFCQSAVYF